MSGITVLLKRMHVGDAQARDALFAIAYHELRTLARARLRSGGRSVVLDTGSLVHECFLRFAGVSDLHAENRSAFFSYASQVMRSVILNSIRERRAERRGGGSPHVTLPSERAREQSGDDERVLKVHEALEELEQVDARLAQVAQMRYFGGYSAREIAQSLGVTERTVQRDWEKAKAILSAALM